jgi:hypothetical protein
MMTKAGGHRRRGIRIGVVIVGAIAILGGSAIAIAATQSSDTGGDAGAPPLTNTSVLSKPFSDPIVGMDFAVPAADETPGISAQDALNAMWKAEGVAGTPPTSAEATFALLTWGDSIKADTPVWIITYDGTCVATEGPSTNSDCRKLPFHTIANADTGEYIVSYADSAGSGQSDPSAPLTGTN